MFSLGWVTTKLSGVLLPLLAVLLIALSLALWRLEATKRERDAAERAAAYNFDQYTGLLISHTLIVDQLDIMTMAFAKKAQTVEKIRKEIQYVPVTRQCVDSPAIRSIIDGLRQGNTNRNPSTVGTPKGSEDLPE